MPDKWENFERLRNIFEGDGAELRSQMIYAGIILTIFERFKKYLVGQLEGFFSEDIEFKNGEVVFRRGREFTSLIKSDAEKTGKKPSPFRTSLRWVHDLGGIDTEEFAEVLRLYEIRNDIGHELFLILADDRKNPIYLYDVIFCFSIYLKIVRWWIKEVELSTDPYISQEQYHSTQMEDIESTDTIFLREVMEKALSNDPQWNLIQEKILRK